MAQRTAARTASALVVALATSDALGGCFRERLCSPGEAQVRFIEYPDAGRACTEDGVVPDGFETLPPGQEPTEVHVD